jgi:hypothetical protein
MIKYILMDTVILNGRGLLHVDVLAEILQLCNNYPKTYICDGITYECDVPFYFRVPYDRHLDTLIEIASANGIWCISDNKNCLYNEIIIREAKYIQHGTAEYYIFRNSTIGYGDNNDLILSHHCFAVNRMHYKTECGCNKWIRPSIGVRIGGKIRAVCNECAADKKYPYLFVKAKSLKVDPIISKSINGSKIYVEKIIIHKTYCGSFESYKNKSRENLNNYDIIVNELHCYLY